MVLDKDATPTATDSGSVASPPHPRKRRRKITDPIPDTAPARNTRSTTRSQILETAVTPFTSTIPQPAPPPLTHVHSPARKPKKKIQNVVKPSSQVYRYLPQDMPDDLGGLMVGLSDLLVCQRG
jgi:hypothetical protein